MSGFEDNTPKARLDRFIKNHCANTTFFSEIYPLIGGLTRGKYVALREALKIETTADKLLGIDPNAISCLRVYINLSEHREKHRKSNRNCRCNWCADEWF